MTQIEQMPAGAQQSGDCEPAVDGVADFRQWIALVTTGMGSQPPT